MNNEIDTRKIKRKLYMSFFQDGLWDIFLGLFLIGWGFAVWFDIPLLPTAVFVGFFWLVFGLKKMITYPRIGYARPVEYRSRALKIVVAGAVFLVAIVILLPAVNKGGFLRNYFELLFNSGMAVAFALIGYWWGITRWYGYAALVFIFAAFNLLGLSYQISFMIPGAVALSYGLIILIRFLRRYPVLQGDGIDENR